MTEKRKSHKEIIKERHEEYKLRKELEKKNLPKLIISNCVDSLNSYKEEVELTEIINECIELVPNLRCKDLDYKTWRNSKDKKTYIYFYIYNKILIVPDSEEFRSDIIKSLKKVWEK